MNSFYNVSGAPVTGSSGSSAVIRSEYALIAAAFDKMPALTASTIVGVNSGGTAMTNYTTTGTGTTVVLSVSPTTTGTFTHAGAAAIFGTGSAGSGVFGASLAQVLTIGTHSTQAEIILDPNNNRGSFGSGDIRFTAISTTASAANAFLDNASGNSLLRSTSSGVYKANVQTLALNALAGNDVSVGQGIGGKPEQVSVVDNLTAVTYTSLAAADDPNRQFVGMIAEDVAAIMPALVTYTKMRSLRKTDPRYDATADPETDIPESVQYERLSVILLAEVQSLRARVAALEAGIP